jgi:hypothetical protein
MPTAVTAGNNDDTSLRRPTAIDAPATPPQITVT